MNKRIISNEEFIELWNTHQVSGKDSQANWYF
jgi:hypothetical protein